MRRSQGGLTWLLCTHCGDSRKACEEVSAGLHLVSPQKPSRQEESEQKIQTPERPKARAPPKLSNFVY